jgi:RHS repeat-associated protein
VSASRKVSFDRDPLGVELARGFPGRVTCRWTRDSIGRPTRRTVTSRDQTIADTRYEWDGDDRLRLREQGDATRAYDYDARGRLVAARHRAGADHRTLDAVGNLYRRPDRSDRRYARGGRIAETSAARYAHDADGHLVEKTDTHGTTRYAWDDAGRLREVALPDGKIVRYAYDVFARRVKKEVLTNGVATREVRWGWDGDRAIEELDAGRGASTWVFDPETFSPLAKLANGKIWGVLTDTIGTPTDLVAEDGSIVAHQDVDTFGAGGTIGIGWPGQSFDDDIGLAYARHRYYDPELGSFISPDPLGVQGALHVYSYPPNPNAWTDPLGLAPVDFATLLHEAQNTLNFDSPRNGAVFWSTPRRGPGSTNMLAAQSWAEAETRAGRPRMTLEQTAGGRHLDSLRLFDPSSGLTGAQAAQIWDAASARFAAAARGEVNVFATDGKRMGAHGERTWWRVERPILDRNPRVTKIVRRRRDGKPCGS